MAKIAHLILGHRQPKQLFRLVDKLIHPNAIVYIHIDKKVSIAPFQELISDSRQVKFIRSRTVITWGTYSMVQATLNSLQEILQDYPSCEYVNLMSESDYPLKDAEAVDDFFDNQAGKSFMEMHFQDSPWWVEAQQKINKYHLVNYRFAGRYLLERCINAISPRRTIPLGMVFTGRSQWWTLSVNHIRYILDFVRKHPGVTHFFRHTWGPDEFFFQTILFNSSYRDEICNDNLRYIEWEDGKVNPQLLTTGHLNRLVNSNKLYARKFDVDVDSHILDLLDLHRRRKEDL